jgi:hypothetical protein
MATLGDFDASTVVYGKFTTYRPSTGAAFTLAGTPALSVYKDNSTTQSTTGVTLTADFDTVTGLNHFAIDTSADGTFYSAGSFFDIVITTGTVDGVSVVGAVVASFTIRKTAALKPTTAGRALDVSATGEAGVDWANVGSPTTAVDLSGTTIKTTQKVDVDTIKTNPVVNGGTITFPTNATVASTTNITGGTITTVTNLTNAPPDSSGVTTLLSRIPSALFSGITSFAQWLGALAGKQTADSTARTEIRATGAGSGTFNETTDSLEAVRDRGDAAWTTATGFSTLDASGVRTAVGLATNNLDTQLAALPTAAENADAVWEEILADHSGTVGSTAEALGAAGSAGDPWLTALPGAYGAGTAGKIIGDNLNATVGSRATQTSVDDIPTNAELATALAAADDAVLAAIAALNNLSAAQVNAEVDTAIADAALATAANLAIAKTAIDGIKAKTDSLTFTKAGEVDANVQSVNDVTVNGTGALGDEWGPA